MLTFKVSFFVSCLIMLARGDEERGPLVGGVQQLSGSRLKEARDQLNYSLNKLAAGEGPHYTLGKIYSVTHQVVSGSLYQYVVDVVDQNKATKKCKIQIWSQPWLENGIEVTFDCDGDSKVVKKHSA